MTLSKNSVAVVTGAGSGIGQALALRLAQEGIAGIALADFNETGLNETFQLIKESGVKTSRHLIDVSKFEQVKRLADEVLTEHDRVTHLVNNAGVAVIGTFEQLSLEDFEWLMSINFWGVIYGCKIFLPILKKEDKAHIINISSVFGLVAPPEQTAYCSSKFALRGFTESLRHELEETNIRVSSVHPGGIKTNIARSSRVGKYTSEAYKDQSVKFFDKVALTSSEKAAEIILQGIKAENPRILIGKDAHAMSYISRLFPKTYLRIIEKLSGHRLDLRKK